MPASPNAFIVSCIILFPSLKSTGKKSSHPLNDGPKEFLVTVVSFYFIRFLDFTNVLYLLPTAAVAKTRESQKQALFSPLPPLRFVHSLHLHRGKKLSSAISSPVSDSRRIIGFPRALQAFVGVCDLGGMLASRTGNSGLKGYLSPNRGVVVRFRRDIYQI